jgi:hypothetical protein
MLHGAFVPQRICNDRNWQAGEAFDAQGQSLARRSPSSREVGGQRGREAPADEAREDGQSHRGGSAETLSKISLTRIR